MVLSREFVLARTHLFSSAMIYNPALDVEAFSERDPAAEILNEAKELSF
jgi:hypothetical protein